MPVENVTGISTGVRAPRGKSSRFDPCFSIEKTCTGCAQSKPLDHFGMARRKGTPYRCAMCKACRALRLTAWKESHHEHVAAYRKAFDAKPERQEKEKARRHKWKLANPDKVKAAKRRTQQRKRVMSRQEIAERASLRRAAEELARQLALPVGPPVPPEVRRAALNTKALQKWHANENGIKDRERKRARKQIKKLAPRYVKSKLRQQAERLGKTFNGQTIPDALVEMKRLDLTIFRELHNRELK